MNQLIAYITIFTGVFFEGEIVFVSGIIAAHQNHLDIGIVIAIGFIATVSSDLLYFLMGKHKGIEWIKNKPKLNRRFLKIEPVFDKRQKSLLLSYRFLYGLRIIFPLMMGIKSIHFQKFITYSIISTTLWVALMSLLGLIFGTTINKFFKHIEDIEFMVIGLLIGLLIVVQIIKKIRHSSIRKSG